MLSLLSMRRVTYALAFIGSAVAAGYIAATLS